MSPYYTMKWEGDHLLLIDQRKLPHEEVYVRCESCQDVANAIRDMVVRGAPAIGVTAAFGVALGIKEKRPFAEIYELLFESRPTAVNLRWALEAMKKHYEQDPSFESMEREAIALYNEDVTTNETMATHGAALIKTGARLLTYCNTGTLATAEYGTALGVIRKAHAQKKDISVFVCETRPYLQGLRLTSWECRKLGIPQTVISDNMAATLMQQRKVDAILVGADRIAANGDTANKIGTYMLAVLANYHDVPFYVVAPTSTIDLRCPTGDQIPIEERHPHEVTHIQGAPIGLKDVNVYNPSFDVTPSILVSAIVTNKGVVKPPYFKALSQL
jgi:methylthioribose-1-phosphate isomerase